MDQAQIQAIIAAATAQLQQQVAALQQQNAAIQQAQAIQPPPPQFVVNPGGGNDPWDFSTSAGLKKYSMATVPLKDQYDGEQDKLSYFLQQLLVQAEEHGWDIVLTAPDANGTTRSIISEHGTLTIADVQQKAQTYLAQQDRARQAAGIVATVLMKSITPRLLERLDHRRAEFMLPVQGQPAVKDGPCMLLALIKMISIDTRATVDLILSKLDRLKPLMDDCKGDVEKFNMEVDKLVDALYARSVPVPNLITKLFQGYRSCGDERFVAYMTHRQDCYLDGRDDFTADQLMKVALEKFKTIGEEWGQQTDRDLEFIAMQTKIKQLEQNAKKTPKVRDSDKKEKASPSGTNKNKGRWAWKGIAPKDGEPHEKKVDGKLYIFCPHHGDTKWVLETNAKGIKHKTGCTKRAEAENFFNVRESRSRK
jgi:hypothetical protein